MRTSIRIILMKTTEIFFSLRVTITEYGVYELIFLRFDLSRIPTEATIQSAQLKLHSGSFSHGGDVSAYYVRDDSWREKGLTYNNKPNISNTVTCTVENISAYSWYSWDITEDVIAAFHDDKILTEALIWGNTAEYGATSFGSRESGRPPNLEITYAVPTTPTSIPTPSPTPTPTPPPTETSWWKEQLWWLIIGVVIALLTLLYMVYKDRRKPRY